MRKLLSAVVAVTSLLAGSVAFACGGAPPTNTTSGASPGFPGTTVAEGSGSISVFTANSVGYSWDRLQLPSSNRTHVANVSGVLSGSVETDVRVSTGIAGQNGQVIEFSAGGSVILPSSSSSTIFGAALSPALLWQVIIYDATNQTLTLFSEATPGTFAQVATLTADCGSPTMLDAVEENDGSFFALCGGQVATLQAGSLQLVKLPSPGVALAKSSAGTAVAYGTSLNGSNLVVMAHSATSGWTSTSTVPTSEAPNAVTAIDETSVLVEGASGFTAYTLQGQNWNASSTLAAPQPVTSATGSPANILSGSYELTVNTTDGTEGGAWTATDLGAIGVAPTEAHPVGDDVSDPSAVGCSTGLGESDGALLALALLALVRMGSRRRA